MRSTLEQLRDFFEGLVWRDIEDELRLWLDDIRNLLESPDGTPFIDDVRRLQGSAEAIRNVLKLPENLIHNKEIELEEEKNGRD